MRTSTLVTVVIVLALVALAAAGGYIFVHQQPAAQGQNLNTQPEEPGSAPGGGRAEPAFSSSPG